MRLLLLIIIVTVLRLIEAFLVLVPLQLNLNSTLLQISGLNKEKDQSMEASEAMSNLSSSWLGGFIFFDAIENLRQSFEESEAADIHEENDEISDRAWLSIDKKKFIRYLISEGFHENDLEFLNQNLDHGYEEIEKELDKIKRDRHKGSKNIDIGGEDDPRKNPKVKRPKSSASTLSYSNSLKALVAICTIFWF